MKPIEKIKKHINENQAIYLSVAGIVLIAGITYAIVRDVKSKHIDRRISAIAKGGTSILGKNVVTNNVSYFAPNRQGPPSWVVRCIETGLVFTSQAKAAIAMDIHPNNLSKHLNGILDSVDGYHFERICMAA